MTTLQELLAQKEALDKQIEDTRRQERSQALAQIKSLMEQFGLTISDLTARSAAPKKSAGAGGGKVAAKFRNQATGETWSGRGLQPRWLKAALAQGAKLSDFAV